MISCYPVLWINMSHGYYASVEIIVQQIMLKWPIFFYNKLFIAILYSVVDTCDDHEPLFVGADEQR